MDKIWDLAAPIQVLFICEYFYVGWSKAVIIVAFISKELPLNPSLNISFHFLLWQQNVMYFEVVEIRLLLIEALHNGFKEVKLFQDISCQLHH